MHLLGARYNIKFYAADSDAGTGPYAPTYLKLGPASLPCPEAARLTGRAVDPLRNAVAYGPTADQLDALTSLNGGSMALGQIVPFEAVIEVSGGPGPERGTIEFTANWSTHTTSNDEFGYDKNYMVYCAFVDAADPGLVDPHYNAKVESFSSALVEAGTINEQIQGTFRVSGLDSGDRVVGGNLGRPRFHDAATAVAPSPRTSFLPKRLRFRPSPSPLAPRRPGLGI